MRTPMDRGQRFCKVLLATALTVGVVTATFRGMTQMVLAAEVGRQETIPTSYPTAGAATGQGDRLTPPAGYEKPAYTLIDNDLDYYRDKRPTDLDLTREEAAEAGVQGLYRVFGLDMDGAVFEMAYNPAADGHRATWEGIWWVNGRKRAPDAHVASYSFTVDALSGEVNSVIHSRVLDAGVDVGFDSALEGNAGAYDAKARELAAQLGLLRSPVQTVEYAGQSVAGNDPEISFVLTGEEGDRAQLQFSRFDGELLAVVFDRGMREMDVSVRNAEAFAQRAEAYFRANPDATTYEE